MIYRQELASDAFLLFNCSPETFIFCLASEIHLFSLLCFPSCTGLMAAQQVRIGTWLLKVITVHVNVLFLLIRRSPRGYPPNQGCYSCSIQENSVIEETLATLK